MYDLPDKRWQTLKADAHKKVILTFDDGPSRQLTSILDILKDKKVHAIFFWQSRLFHHKREWQRVLQEGHLIGSHAHNHKNLMTLSKAKQRKQIKESVEKFKQTTGTNVRLFRPPFGRYNEDTIEILRELKLTPVMWRLSSYDWELKLAPEKIICNIVEHLEDGAIILLHELKQTVTVLPELIGQIREKGYEFTLL